MTYFSTILRCSISNRREWYVEEFKNGNSLHKIHIIHKIAYKTFAECEKALLLLIKKEGGTYLLKPPTQGRRTYKGYGE